MVDIATWSSARSEWQVLRVRHFPQSATKRVWRILCARQLQYGSGAAWMRRLSSMKMLTSFRTCWRSDVVCFLFTKVWFCIAATSPVPEEYLGGTHRIYKLICSPMQLGWKDVNRRRTYRVLVRRDVEMAPSSGGE